MIIALALCVALCACAANNFAFRKRRVPPHPPRIPTWLLAMLYTVTGLALVGYHYFSNVIKEGQNAGGEDSSRLGCAVVTLGCMLPIPRIVRRLKAELHAVSHQPEIQLSQQSQALGLFGLLMFLLGVVDLITDVGLCAELLAHGEWMLLVCALVTCLATTATTMHLGFHLFEVIATHNGCARAWALENGKLMALVLVLSTSRLESLAILRLRLCGRDLLHMPMEHRHFHFIRQAGVFHYVVEDLPHAAVSIAQLVINGKGSVWAELNLGFSALSIIFGLVNKGVQLLVLRAVNRGADLRETLLSERASTVTVEEAGGRGTAQGPNEQPGCTA